MEDEEEIDGDLKTGGDDELEGDLPPEDLDFGDTDPDDKFH